MRLNDNRLMEQLETAFRLANALDREGPQTRRPRHRQVHIDPQPLVDQAAFVCVDRVKPRAELTETAPFGAVEVAIVGAGGQAGEIELDREVQRMTRRQPFE